MPFREVKSRYGYTGLLTGRDVIKSALRTGRPRLRISFDALMLYVKGTDVFLDDISKKDIETALGIRLKIIETPLGGIIRRQAGGQMKISGKTKVLGFLGFPVGHNLCLCDAQHWLPFNSSDCWYVTFWLSRNLCVMR